MKSVAYLDASAIVKIIAAEPESEALVAYLGQVPAQTVTARIGMVEVMRAAARHGNVDVRRALSVLDALAYIELTSEVAMRAGGLAPTSVRSLDAIHLASALGLRRELTAFVTYDERLADAARVHGLPVMSPA